MTRAKRLTPRTKGSSSQRRGPLKKILKIVIAATCRMERNLVELECGHRVYSRGSQQARCDQCFIPAREK
jgi:hypothetical protein